MPGDVPPLIEETTHEGRRALRYNFHPGQQRAWASTKRVVAVIAGKRSGKTSFSPLWLHREMQRCGPGDYGAFVPVYHILDKALRPAIEDFFGRRMRLGTASQYKFEMSEDGHRRLWPGVPFERPSRILYGHASRAESLAAMQLKAAVADEPGQKEFRLDSFHEIRSRLSIDLGRLLLTTTIYNLGWLKQQIWDRWEQAKRDHPDFDVVNFDSTQNPAFPRSEWEQALRDLPRWKFDLWFRAIPTRPAGLIYDCFDPRHHVVPRYRLPDDWPRYAGMDFGAVNTAAVYFAAELGRDRQPTGNYVAYREYPDREFLPGKHAAQTHAVRMLKGEPTTPLFVGGSASEDEWRQKFRDAGLPVAEPPISGVEEQIDSLYRMIANGRLKVMDDLAGLLDQLASYSRVLDEAGEPTDEIDSDNLYHYLAACRYFAAHAERGGAWRPTVARGDRSVISDAPPGVFDPGPRRDRDDPRKTSAGGGHWLDDMFPTF